MDSVFLTKTKQYDKRVHSSTKLTPIPSSLKKNEIYVCQNFLYKRWKINAKFQVNDLVKTADSKRTFSKEVQLIGLINYT